MKEKKLQGQTQIYHYYNCNPHRKLTDDCVIRAITKALRLDYYEVVRLLNLNACEFQCDCLNVKCYEKLLDYDFDLPHYMSFDLTAQEVANDYKDKILLLRMEGHLSCSLYGDIHDIWDCSNEIITDFWVVN